MATANIVPFPTNNYYDNGFGYYHGKQPYQHHALGYLSQQISFQQRYGYDGM